MTADEWLREKARVRQFDAAVKNDEEQIRKIFAAQVDVLWSQLQAEVRRQVDIYNEAASEPDSLVLETHPDLIDITASWGPRVAIRLNRHTQTLSETRYLEPGHAIGTPHFGFTITSGRLAFTSGEPDRVAIDILCRVLD